MANGSVVRYDGKRGTVWRIKYPDADGKQVMETVGAERDGVTEKQARELLAERLVDVRRKGYRRPQPLTFAAYADRWFEEEGKLRRDWRPGTVSSYQTGLRHLTKYFGPLAARVDPAARHRRATHGRHRERFAPKTVNLQLNLSTTCSRPRRRRSLSSEPGGRCGAGEGAS